MIENKFAQPWKKISQTWKRFDVGVRPSRKNILDMEHFFLSSIGKKKNIKALVFGSTPEIRDMLAKYKNVDVTIFDINIEMTLAMTDLMRRKNDSEVWCKGDWLNPPLRQNYYDVSFGDFIKGNIPFAKQHSLYRNIHSLLKPGGTHIERIFSKFPDTYIQDIDLVIKKYSKIKPTYKSAGDLLGILTFLVHNEYVCRSDRPFEILNKYKNVSHMKQYEKLIHNLIGPGKIWDYGRPWNQDKKPIEKYFKIIDKTKDNTVFKTGCYVFKMRSKKNS